MDWNSFISQYDLVYQTPPACWQDGLFAGNGSMGMVYYVDECLQFLINKTDVLDGRTHPVKKILTQDQAQAMIRDGATQDDFRNAEQEPLPARGVGPKTCCTVSLDLGASLGSGKRPSPPAINSHLSLYDATLRLQLDKHLCHPRIQSYIHATENLAVIEVSNMSALPGLSNGDVHFGRPHDVEIERCRITVEQDRLVMRMTMPDAFDYVAVLQVVPTPTHTYRDTHLQRIRPQWRPPDTGNVRLTTYGEHAVANVSGNFCVYLTVVTEREADDPAARSHRLLDAAIAKAPDTLHQEHASWWADFWHKSWVELSDKPLEHLFYTSLYMLGSCYRSSPMSGLVGLWYGPGPGAFQSTPWTGDLHNDLNVQCPFFPVHMLNHSELFDAYLDTYDDLLPEARRLAREIWQAPGAHFDMCNNAAGKSITGGVGPYRYYFGGAYVALMHCFCWQYRRDIEQLRTRIYPFLKEILAFYMHMLHKGQDGRYHLWPAHAAELDIMDVTDPVLTMSMLRHCLHTAVEASRILEEDDQQLVGQWQDVLDNLPEYAIATDWAGREVIVDGVGVPADHHVGQAGCLHPIYPVGEVDQFSDAQILELYQRTYESVCEKTAELTFATDSGHHYKCLWECFFRAMAALRLGYTDQFWEHYLPTLIRAHSKPNGMISHDSAVLVDHKLSEANLAAIPDRPLLDKNERMPTFEPWFGSESQSSPSYRTKQYSIGLIEGNGDYLTMLTECLLQSNGGLIRIFPAWPKNRNAQFTNLVAEGNVLVSAVHLDGQVSHVWLTPGDPGTTVVRLLSPWTQQIIDIPVTSGTTYHVTSDGISECSQAEPEPWNIESARPRILRKDRHGTLWLGSPADQR